MRISGRLTLALCASAAVVLAAPFVGDVRAAIQASFPGYYREIVLAVVGTAVALAVAGAVIRIRDRRALRFGLLGAALLVAVAYASATSSGNPEVDAVEYFHFVEYGLLAVLYHRAWRERGDLSAFALPVTAGLLVGTADEWLQWLVPFRVGELRDVLLNGAALLCGLLFAAGLHPPGRPVFVLRAGSRATLARLGAVSLVAVAAFFHTVHIGHEVRLGNGTLFLSRFSADDLAAAAVDRAARWDGRPPIERRLSREDHYLSEGRWHIEERNEAVTSSDFGIAWNEQRILDTFYSPVLAALPDAQWPAAQRAEVESRAAGTGEFSSNAHPHPIYPWSPALFWVAAGAGIVVLAWLALPGASSGVRTGEPA